MVHKNEKTKQKKLKACIIYLAKQDFTVSESNVHIYYIVYRKHEKFCFLKKKMLAQKGKT